MKWLHIALGGAFGSVLRYWFGGFISARLGAPIWGTLAVNFIGSFCIGWVAAQGRGSTLVQHFVMVGILGGFTTFSTFSLQTLELLQSGQTWLAFINIALSLALCMGGVWLGMRMG